VVGFVAEHIAHFQLFHCRKGFGVLRICIGFGGGVLPGKFEPYAEVFYCAGYVMVTRQPRFQRRDFF
jgi:hypothetical protein